MSVKVTNPEWRGLFLRDFADIQNGLYENIPSSRWVKRQLIKEGYSHQLSMYGIVSEKENDESHFKRIEVLSNTPYTGDLIFLLYEFFKDMIVPDSYTIWRYDKDREAVALERGFN